MLYPAGRHLLVRTNRANVPLVLDRPRSRLVPVIDWSLACDTLTMNQSYDLSVRTKPRIRRAPRLLKRRARMKDSQENACDSNHCAFNSHKSYLISRKPVPQTLGTYLTTVLVGMLIHAELSDSVTRAY